MSGLTDRPTATLCGRTLTIVLLLFVLSASSVAAQGKGKKIGHRVNSPVSTGSAAPLSSGASPSTLQYGSWLDDASLIGPGGAWTSISVGHFRLSGISQTDFPVVDAALGLTDSVQFGLTVPYYRVHFAEGSPIGGLGDIYASAKVAVVDPSRTGRSFGLAIAPVAEILEQPMPGGSKVAWGLPFTLEFRADGYRVFGSTGFFSRGAFFGGGAMEMPVTEKLIMTGALTFTRSLKEDFAAQAAGIPRNKSDVTVAAAYVLTPQVAAFIGTGRTLGANPSATTLMINGGLSLSLAPRTLPRSPRSPR